MLDRIKRHDVIGRKEKTLSEDELHVWLSSIEDMIDLEMSLQNYHKPILNVEIFLLSLEKRGRKPMSRANISNWRPK